MTPCQDCQTPIPSYAKRCNPCAHKHRKASKKRWHEKNTIHRLKGLDTREAVG